MTEVDIEFALNGFAEQPSAFRTWCSYKWMEHKDEVFNWENKFPEYDSTYYFRKHRWMLRRMFKEEQKEQKNV